MIYKEPLKTISDRKVVFHGVGGKDGFFYKDHQYRLVYQHGTDKNGEPGMRVIFERMTGFDAMGGERWEFNDINSAPDSMWDEILRLAAIQAGERKAGGM